MGTYGTLKDHAENIGIKGGRTGPNGTKWDQMEPNGTIRDSKGP